MVGRELAESSHKTLKTGNLQANLSNERRLPKSN